MGGHRDDGRVPFAILRADVPGGFEAAHLGHLQIHQDGVVTLLGRLRYGRQAVVDHIHPVPQPFQQSHRQRLIDRVVLGQQQRQRAVLAGREGGCAARAARPGGGDQRVQQRRGLYRPRHHAVDRGRQAERGRRAVVQKDDGQFRRALSGQRMHQCPAVAGRQILGHQQRPEALRLGLRRHDGADAFVQVGTQSRIHLPLRELGRDLLAGGAVRFDHQQGQSFQRAG